MRIRYMAMVGIMAVLAAFFFSPTAPTRADEGAPAKAAKGKLRAATIKAGSITRTAPTLSSGIVSAAADALRTEVADAAGGASGNLSAPAAAGVSPGTLGCSRRDGSEGHSSEGQGNVRVNQDCTYRSQIEEQIISNPADPNNLLAGQNDRRAGFNQCGFDYSTDNGRHWGDGIPPFRQKLNSPLSQEPTTTDPNRHTIQGGPGTNHTYDAGSDPAVTFDSQGNGYFSCLAFDVNSNANMLYVTASPAAAKGSFFFNLAPTDKAFIVAEDNSPLVFHDKQFITADASSGSPNHDNVYVTWTVYTYGTNCGPQPSQSEQFCSSPIFGALSTDHARTWSTPEEISGASTTLCFFGNQFDPTAPQNACNFDTGSEPRALPNGDLQVIFNNSNTAANNPNGQQLGVHCKPTGSSPAGTARLNCAAPAKVGDDVLQGEPQCDFGFGSQECIPGAYIRTNDFPRLAVNPANGHLFATWQDYRNGEFDIQLSTSVDGGLTWKEAGTVNPDRGLDHYMPAIDTAKWASANGPDGQDHVGASYFRSERVPNENTLPTGGFAHGQPGVQQGMSDYVLSGGTRSRLPYDFTVVSPSFVPPNGIQAGFNGDYSGLAINKGAEAHPIWSDTRNLNPFPENGVTNDEDVFTDKVDLPNGQAKPSVGHIGKR